MQKANKLIKVMNRVLEVISMVLLAGIIVAAVLQVFTRKVLGDSMVGTEEFARYCFIAMSCLGASLCVSKGSHASVDMLRDILKGRGRNWHGIFCGIVELFVCYILIRYGFALLSSVSRQSSPTLGIPMSYVYGVLPISCICMALSALTNIINEIMNIRCAKESKKCQ